MDTTLDQKWFARFHDVATSTSDYDFLQQTVRVTQAERERFFVNEVENPLFQCKETTSFVSQRQQIETLRQAIQSEELNEAVKGLYLQKIENHFHRIDILDATVRGDDEQFYKASVALYGAPQKEHFAYIAGRVQQLCEGELPADSKASAKRLQSVFAKIDTSVAVISSDILPDVVEDESDPLTAAEVAEVFSDTLTAYSIPDWQVMVDVSGDRQRFAVNTYKHIVHIPGDEALSRRRVPFTTVSAQALAEHEVGVHVRRAYNGRKQPLQLLSLGLDGYLSGEEGLASYVQQQVEGATEFYGFDRYMAISLAVGLDGAPRDFRSVFTLMADYYTLTLQTRHNVKERAQAAAWDVCLRIYRGTTGQGTGTVFTRDLAYMSGNIGMWQFIIDHPERFDSLFVGKFDPMNQQHVTDLQSLAILPDW